MKAKVSLFSKLKFRFVSPVRETRSRRRRLFRKILIVSGKKEEKRKSEIYSKVARNLSPSSTARRHEKRPKQLKLSWLPVAGPVQPPGIEIVATDEMASFF